jgi:hypothetical protein
MCGDFTVDEIVEAIKRVWAGKQLARSRNVATDRQRLDRGDGDRVSLG